MERCDFATFFAAVNSGATPFRWQERLLDWLLEHGCWPERIAAPTGAGKTSAIDVHVFAVALSAGCPGPRLPRRLVMTVDRRVLVDDQYRRAVQLASDLAGRRDEVVAEVAERLVALRWPAGDGGTAIRADKGSPLVTGRMRGGAVPSRSWRDHPGACAVLCATPDMWGSRLLFGGYGTPALAAPREAGLLAFDSAVVVDEAHLAGQLLVTARRVARLATAAETPVTAVPALQVVEVSATPASAASGRSITIDHDDLAEEMLAARLTRPKPVAIIPVAGWAAPGKLGKTAAAAADAAEAMLTLATGNEQVTRTVGCFVNTVPMAVAVAGLLRARSTDVRQLRVVMVCGQVRPADVARLEKNYPGIFSPNGSRDVDVIVTTQSLEVGVNLDLAGIVTELAAGSALAQRAGRANRRGLRPHAPVTVLVPAEALTGRSRSGPYTAPELAEALDWVSRRAGDPAGMAPWALRENPPPSATPRRLLYQRPELADAWHWARTSDDLAAEPQLDLWLAESLEDETSIGIVVRDAMPTDPAEAVGLVRDLPPAPWEVFPVPYRTALAVLSETPAESRDAGSQPDGNGEAGGDEEGEKDRPWPSSVRVRGEEVTPLQMKISGDDTRASVRPGDIVVLDASVRIFTPPPADGFSPPVVAAASAVPGSPGLSDRAATDDVLHLPPDVRDGSLVFRLEAAPGHRLVAGISHQAASAALQQLAGREVRTERELRGLLAAAIAPLGCLGAVGQCVSELADRVGSLLRGRVRDSDVVVQPAGDGLRVIVTDQRRPAADEDLHQVLTPATDPVTLPAHQRAVADRARLLADEVGLGVDVADALYVAGAHHDDGKADPRFQQLRLGLPPGNEVLAKSLPGATVRQVLVAEGQAGLRAGWRHEQRSVADCWDQVHAEPGIDPLLALRLVGTSHGRGRSSFPHTSRQLKHDTDSKAWQERAAMLFDEGAWEELIEITQARYGVWGCAYLEALLRAADCQVSGEGR
jgi:CRISPR-associated endonuclease/helicase Cas3